MVYNGFLVTTTLGSIAGVTSDHTPAFGAF